MWAAAGLAPVGAAAQPAPEAIADSVLRGLPLRQRIAQLVMPWVDGAYAAADDPRLAPTLAAIDSLGVGGVIISVGSPLDVAARLNDLQRRSRLPLLVGSDLESGTAIRLVGGTAFPPNMGVAAGGDERRAYDIGRATALEGRAVGIHLAFAPDADVNSNPANPIINVRSFGEEPARVAAFVAAAVRGIQDHGMLAVAKHFPGHGDTETDSHLALPTVRADWRRLDSLELVPFRAAVQAGVTGVMSAHVTLPLVDGEGSHPATLQPALLGGLLRDSLGFGGLIVTDAMDMAGVAGRWGAGEAAVLAVLAGADLLLQPRDAFAVVAALEAAVAAGRVPAARIDESARRVLTLKARLGLFAERTVPLDSVTMRVGRADLQQRARLASLAGLVLARDDARVLERARARRGRRTVITYAPADQARPGMPPAGAVLADELRRAGDTVRLVRLDERSGPAAWDSARTALADAPYAIVAVAVRPTSGVAGALAIPAPLQDLVDAAAARRQPLLLVSLGSPYIVADLPRAPAYLVGWHRFAPGEWAVAQALLGGPVGGRLPVTLPPGLPRGAGLQLEATREWLARQR